MMTKGRWFFAVSVVAALLGGQVVAFGQIDEPINIVRQPIGIGARALGLGGAYTAVANDYTALYWNPAGLAMIRKMEFNLGMSHTRHKDEATAVGVTTTDHMSRTRFNTLGFVLPVPTYRGSLVFAFGYHRPKTFDGSFAFEWFNPTSDDKVEQRWNEFEEGYLSVWSFGGAMDMSPNLSVGAALNFWGGTNEYQWAFREYDRDNLYTFSDYVSEDYIGTRIKSTEVKVGAVYRLGRLLRLGATASLPRTVQFSEDWSTTSRTTYDDQQQETSHDEGGSEYKLSFPFRFSAGIALRLLNIMATGEVEYTDWSQVKYKTDPPVQGLTRTEANLAIHERFRPITTVKVGAEFTLPLTGIQFRGGVAVVPSPLRGASRDLDQTFVSLGLGVLLDKQLKLDVGWTRGTWTRTMPSLSESPDVTSLTEKVYRDVFMATLAFRF